MPLRVKRTGFSWPCNSLQVFAWFAVLYCSLTSYLVVLPKLPSLWSQILFGTVFSASHGGMLVIGTLATASDPTDSVVYLQRTAARKGLRFDASRYAGFCTLCNCYVSVTAKHCGQCNRCVAVFDHHCKWLNNCIGSTNYKLFAGLLLALQVSQLSALVASAAVLYDFSQLSTLGAVLSSLLLVQSMCVTVGNGYLILLHIWLRVHKLTTYEYLTSKRQRREASRTTPEISQREKCNDIETKREQEETRLKVGIEAVRWDKKETEAADYGETKTVHSPTLHKKDTFTPPPTNSH